MRKVFDLEFSAQEGFGTRAVLHGHGDIKIERNDRFRVSVDGQAANDAIPDAGVLEKSDHSLQKIAAIHSHRLPETKRLHASSIGLSQTTPRTGSAV
jgi:hypothetical protein